MLVYILPLLSDPFQYNNRLHLLFISFVSKTLLSYYIKCSCHIKSVIQTKYAKDTCTNRMLNSRRTQVTVSMLFLFPKGADATLSFSRFHHWKCKKKYCKPNFLALVRQARDQTWNLLYAKHMLYHSITTSSDKRDLTDSKLIIDSTVIINSSSNICILPFYLTRTAHCGSLTYSMLFILAG